jgi:hypothetical protein
MTDKAIQNALYAIGGIAAGGVCMGVGYLIGVDQQRKFTMKRFNDSQPLLTKILVDLYAEAIKEGITQEEFTKVVDTEINFLRLVTE